MKEEHELPEASPSGFVTCSKCGKMIGITCKFCPYCGEPSAFHEIVKARQQ